jgi:hypothetical protein
MWNQVVRFLQHSVWSLVPMMGVFFVFILFPFWSRDPLIFQLQSTAFHTLGGAATAWTFFRFFFSQKLFTIKVLERVWLVCVLVAMTAVVGVAWEWMELYADVVFGGMLSRGVFDTLLDITADMCGALLVGLFISKR